MYSLNRLDFSVLEEIRKKDGKSIREICTRFFPAYSEWWIREKIRRLELMGLVEKTGKATPRAVRITDKGRALLENEVG